MDARLDIIKNAMLLEKQGETFYLATASTTKHPEVKELFETFAREEVEHFKTLQKMFENIKATGKVAASTQLPEMAETVDKILTDKIRESVKASDYEAAAIAASMNFEEKAVKYYAEQADRAEDENEKKLYTELSNWEKTHLHFLADLNDSLREDIWNDQNFWPMV